MKLIITMPLYYKGILVIVEKLEHLFSEICISNISSLLLISKKPWCFLTFILLLMEFCDAKGSRTFFQSIIDCISLLFELDT